MNKFRKIFAITKKIFESELKSFYLILMNQTPKDSKPIRKYKFNYCRINFVSEVFKYSGCYVLLNLLNCFNTINTESLREI